MIGPETSGGERGRERRKSLVWEKKGRERRETDRKKARKKKGKKETEGKRKKDGG